MKALYKLTIPISVLLLAIALAPACSTEQDQPDENLYSFACDQGYEIVLNAFVQSGQEQSEYRYWLVEFENGYLSGKVRDQDSDRIYPVAGFSDSLESLGVTFRPDDYAGYQCPQRPSLTLQIKGAEGLMKIYCDLDVLGGLPAVVEFECDDRGVSLED